MILTFQLRTAYWWYLLSDQACLSFCVWENITSDIQHSKGGISYLIHLPPISQPTFLIPSSVGSEGKKNSTWSPPEGRNDSLDLYIECFCRRAQAEIMEKQHRLPHNLSRAERNAIHSLRNHPDIIIKEADKGGAVVIMNRSDYQKEAARQLSNTKFYRPLPSDPTEEYTKKLHHLLRTLPILTPEQINIPLEPRPGLFYLLPKIHKPGNPGRPIILGFGTLTEGLSGYVDCLLRPYATSTPSYLRDTTDFLRKLQCIGDLPENTILATMDVEAVFTNIPHTDRIQAVRNSIPDDATAQLAAELCPFILTHNYFKFDDNIYLQISGTAMGPRMAPQYANIL
uniref:Reverse transcriptase domain-containing protein n=1 Tax=Gopherus evgoodei TaxID=1825980 RepID=A0A8C4VK70_9SAUR